MSEEYLTNELTTVTYGERVQGSEWIPVLVYLPSGITQVVVEAWRGLQGGNTGLALDDFRITSCEQITGMNSWRVGVPSPNNMP